MTPGFRIARGRPGSTGKVQVQMPPPFGRQFTANTPVRTSGCVKVNSKTRYANSIFGVTSQQIYDDFLNDDTCIPAEPVIQQGITDVVLPAYQPIVKPKGVVRYKGTDNAAVTNKKFDSYEKLTGISQERPEMILMSEFSPLFENEGDSSQTEFTNLYQSSGVYPNMTDTGVLFESQIARRNIKSVNIIQFFRRIRRRNFHFHNVYKDRKKKMDAAIGELKDLSQFLMNLVNRTDDLKEQFDLRNSIYTVRTDSVIKNMTQGYTKTRKSWLNNELQNLGSKILEPTYELRYVLRKFGYTKNSVNNVFSSTKIWLQILEEYKDMLSDHSNRFILPTATSQKNDDNATVINKKDVPTFNIATVDPAGLPFLNEIVGSSPSEVHAATRNIANAYAKIYSFGARWSSTEGRIAALANALTKEYNYSRGLNDSRVRSLLNNHYGYRVNDGFSGTAADAGNRSISGGNLSIFDWVVGRFVNNISDVPTQGGTDSTLALLAQKQVKSDITVLPFESKYIEGENGTLTPGSKYYVDTAMGVEFSNGVDPTLAYTQRLESFGRELHKSKDNFAIIVEGLNIWGVSDYDSSQLSSKNIESVMGNSSKFMKRILNRFLDNKGRTRKSIKDDRLTSVLSLATGSRFLKSQFFLYFMNKMAQNYVLSSHMRASAGGQPANNAPFIDKVAGNIVDEAARITRSSRMSLFNTTSNASSRQSSREVRTLFTSDQLRTSIKTGTKLTNEIESIMTEILNEYGKSKVISERNDRTLMSGHMDTTMMMVVFDMILSIVQTYGNQKIIARTNSDRTNKTFTFFVSKTGAVYRNSSNNLLSRLKKERALLQQTSYAIYNTMDKLENKITGYVNHLQSDHTKRNLRQIGKIVDDDRDFQNLMSKQQIMLLYSQVLDLRSRLNQEQAEMPYADSAAKDGDFDADDTIKIIDDMGVTENLRNIVYGYFQQPGLAGHKAMNKRILSIGLPLGFSKNLQQKVKISKQNDTSYDEKQNDIIQLSVFKVDLLNSDLIFKPQKFLFELSRFPVRNNKSILPLHPNPTMDKLMSAMPTRDFDEGHEDPGGSISFWSKNNNSQGTRAALDAESYAFLTSDEKEEIIQNHLMSYMCEIYLKILTGISTAELSFGVDIDKPTMNMANNDFVRLISTAKIAQISQFFKFKQIINPKIRFPKGRGKRTPRGHKGPPSPGVLFGSSAIQKAAGAMNSFSKHSMVRNPRFSSFSGVGSTIRQRASYIAANIDKSLDRASRRNNVDNPAASLKDVSPRKLKSVMHSIRTIGHFRRLKTSLSSGNLVKRDVLRPKQFDRIFNLIIDPDEFEIDYSKTTETNYGKAVLDQLIKKNVLSPSKIDTLSSYLYSHGGGSNQFKKGLNYLRNIQKGQNLSDVDHGNFVTKKRNRAEGDVIFEKYFITVQTYGDEDV
jgi:hypothetical protein